jgi:hypothetical protein
VAEHVALTHRTLFTTSTSSTYYALLHYYCIIYCIGKSEAAIMPILIPNTLQFRDDLPPAKPTFVHLTCSKLPYTRDIVGPTLNA